MRYIKAFIENHGSQVFNIIESRLHVSDFYHGEEIVAISPLKLSLRTQPFTPSALEGDGEYLMFFHVFTKPKDSDWDFEYCYNVAMWVSEDEL